MAPKISQTPVLLPHYDSLMHPTDEIVVESVDTTNKEESLF